MEFFKNLFTNDNSIIGLCGFDDDEDRQMYVGQVLTDCNYAPPVNLMYKNQQHLKNIFGC